VSGAPDGAREAARLFARTFGGEPAIVASAPGRVNLIGEHTDYNGGQVLPIAIDRRLHVAARANGGATVRAVSAQAGEAGEFPLEGARPAAEWWDYVAGTAMHLWAHGVPLRGADLAVWSEIPAGSGLGSSAALAVAAGLALARTAGADVAPRELALAARRAEEEFVGVAVGIMDQFAAALAREGHALRIWCDSGQVEHVPFAEHVLVFDTGVRRSLRDGRFNARREECVRALALLQAIEPGLGALAAATPELVARAALPAPLDARARHVASEMRRVREAAAALERGAALPGDILYASHASLRDDYACSCAELDWFVAHARAAGLRGARLTGAGWGGCAIATGDREALARAAPAIAGEYQSSHARAPRWWITGAAAGASSAPCPSG